MDKNNYFELKKEYGKMSSWAIWSPVTKGPKSNTSNLELLNDDYLLDHVNTEYVLVGLNVSSDKGLGKANEEDWSNFHSSHRGQNDYKLRYALEGTRLWGSYITDIIKECKNSDSKQVMEYYKNGPINKKKIKEKFLSELSLIGDDIHIVAMGNSSFEVLTDLFPEKNIIKIMHYAARISPINYRKHVLERINSL